MIEEGKPVADVVGRLGYSFTALTLERDARSFTNWLGPLIPESGLAMMAESYACAWLTNCGEYGSGRVLINHGE